jgi:hypothetical protein
VFEGQGEAFSSNISSNSPISAGPR